MVKHILVMPQDPSVTPAGHFSAGLLPSSTTLSVPLPLTCPLPMCVLPQLLLPAAVAVFSRGKRTGWTEASERRKAAENFGACGGPRSVRGRPWALARARPLAIPGPCGGIAALQAPPR